MVKENRNINGRNRLREPYTDEGKIKNIQVGKKKRE